MTTLYNASQPTSSIPAHWDERLYSLYGSPKELSTRSRTAAPHKSVVQPQQQTATLAHEMHTIWCEETEEACTPLPAYLAQRLLSFLETAMYHSTDRWRTYCRKIASSQFLMGEIAQCPFKADLSWIIKQINFNNIESGKYIVGDREHKKIKLSDIEQQVQTSIATQPTAETQALHRYLYQELGAFTYYHWFRDMCIRIANDQLIVFKFASEFHISRIKSHYELVFTAAVKTIYPSFTTYEMCVSE